MLFGKYLAKYYKKYWALFLIGVVMLIVVDVAQTFIPRFLGRIIDENNELIADLAQLGEIVGYVMLCAGIMFAGRFVWRISIFRASTGIAAGLRKEMFDKAEKLSSSYYHITKVGNIMNWFTSDIEEVSDFFGWGTVMIVDALFLSASCIVSMVRLNPWLTILLMIPILLIAVWGLFGDRLFTKRWEQRQAEYDRLYDFAQENFTGIRVIKSFVKQTKEIAAFSKIARKNQDVNVRYARLNVLFDVVIESVIILAMTMLLGVGGWMVYATATGTPSIIFGQEVKLTAGELMQFVGYVDLIIWPMFALGNIISMRSRAKGSLKRISAFLDTPFDVVNPLDGVKLENAKGDIEFRDFTFVYPDGTTPALSNISIHIAPGEHIGIVGKVGSGKTAFVNALFRLYNVEKGQLFVDGHDIMECDIPSLREVIAYAPQDNFLFSDTIENNISFSSGAVDHGKVEEASSFADVKENIESFPRGYDTVLGERGVTLSGGQKQRVSIARAFYKDAPVLVLDDCVSAVDVKTEEIILGNIKRQRAGKTTLLIASRVSSVSQMDKILVIEEGRAIAFGPHHDLVKTCPAYAKMVYLQQLEREVEGGGANG
ncbi:MAG: ABC transporter ATP-binding protein/permease [Bacilli bacterium]|nr:ABC transporter ATP-binding protein/permease [Bacilli bacterium]